MQGTRAQCWWLVTSGMPVATAPTPRDAGLVVGIAEREMVWRMPIRGQRSDTIPQSAPQARRVSRGRSVLTAKSRARVGVQKVDGWWAAMVGRCISPPPTQATAAFRAWWARRCLETPW